MKCIIDSEIDDWLRERSIPRDPYGGNSSPAFYLQFHPPSKHRHLDAFTRHYYSRIIPESESLIDMTDWGLYQQSEMIAVTGIRSSYNEGRLLIDAPGHCLIPKEKEIGVSLFSLSASFAWSSYLYSPLHLSTLYNWEGDIFDFWTDSEKVHSEMKLILKQFDLAETSTGEQDSDDQPPTGPESI